MQIVNQQLQSKNEVALFKQIHESKVYKINYTMKSK